MAGREGVVALPVEALSFAAEENKLKADFSLDFYVYSKKNASKDRFTRTKSFEMTEAEALEMEKILLTFPHELAPGDYFFDVSLFIQPDIGKIRKIFRIRVR